MIKNAFQNGCQVISYLFDHRTIKVGQFDQGNRGREEEEITMISDQLLMAIAAITLLALIVSCVLSKVYDHVEPIGHMPVCTRYAPIPQFEGGPAGPPPPYIMAETPV